MLSMYSSSRARSASDNPRGDLFRRLVSISIMADPFSKVLLSAYDSFRTCRYVACYCQDVVRLAEVWTGGVVWIGIVWLSFKVCSNPQDATKELVIERLSRDFIDKYEGLGRTFLPSLSFSLKHEEGYEYKRRSVAV